MGDNYYPTVDTAFIVANIIKSGKVIPDSQLKVGSSITFVLKGNKALHKRLVKMREVDGSINYMQATGLAVIFGFIGDLLAWCEENRDWKEGGYFVRENGILELEETEEE
ncbi:hypothetical protein N4T20_14460 [Flavobacterium sp. TR2]|uniref:hypothetical protein n=1 Tax=Flavobacterium sp. TR2 TaxID=2977321 RepID=UPI0021B11530|nr:hypothetical protein [Flavobacterium sp. TR2]UWY26923.1 hypothetical protein N4T20_14460 [Flavobacterium sp. TR2]